MQNCLGEQKTERDRLWARAASALAGLRPT